MHASEQTFQQISRALHKAAAKFPKSPEEPLLTDIYLMVERESGELRIYDDDDKELTRCVVEEWIDNREENFYEEVQPILTKAILDLKDETENLPILKPYSFVLVDEDHETIAELHLVDDENILISEELMKGLDEDLRSFWEKLSAD